MSSIINHSFLTLVNILLTRWLIRVPLDKTPTDVKLTPLTLYLFHKIADKEEIQNVEKTISCLFKTDDMHHIIMVSSSFFQFL